MHPLYELGIRSYHLAIRLARLWSPKARLWVSGRKGWHAKLKAALPEGAPRVWFHCASLGEFEQGRPLIEAYKRQDPQVHVVLTFYSPSGYEVRKNYAGADTILYLPPDGASNARTFLDLLQPQAAFFVKYEFWYHYLWQLQQRSVPTFLVSGIFRPSQPFFKPLMGRWMRKMLAGFAWMFVQDEASLELLKTFELNNASVAGDTRFDRVYEIVRAAKRIPEVEAFKGGSLMLVAGSTWPRDEDLLAPLLLDERLPLKAVIAPHEIGEGHLQLLAQRFGAQAVFLSKARAEDVQAARVLIVDSIGLLSSIYQYGELAYVGGGFGAGIHNVPEAAAWGIPVVFGPNHKKFREAVELMQQGGAVGISSAEEGREVLRKFLTDTDARSAAGRIAGQYVENAVGATERILSMVRALNSPTASS